MTPALVSILQAKLAHAGYDPGPQDGVIGPATYAALFSYMAQFPLGDNGQAIGRDAAAQFPRYDLLPPLRMAHWLAQAKVESAGFRKFEENLNYSAQRLCAVWPHRFPSIVDARPYSSNPEALANKVYGGRLGNDQPGDGWKYRGRGAGLTGKANYAAAADRTGLDLVNHPEIAAEPEHFVHIFCDFWASRGLNAAADRDDLPAVTRGVNGGLNGLDDRRVALARAKAVLL